MLGMDWPGQKNLRNELKVFQAGIKGSERQGIEQGINWRVRRKRRYFRHGNGCN